MSSRYTTGELEAIDQNIRTMCVIYDCHNCFLNKPMNIRCWRIIHELRERKSKEYEKE
jgi:hypothetical protein